jgi:site-specific DNA-methyltransferase (adenine-specific)
MGAPHIKFKDLPLNSIITADNFSVLRKLPNECIDMIINDPPFNTGTTKVATVIKTEQDDKGDRVGFGGKTYKTIPILDKNASFSDSFDDYLGYLYPRMVDAHRALKPTGSLFMHLDYREVHYVKVMLDSIFGRDNFINEIIWAYDFGAKSKRKWPTKHDNILFYAKDAKKYYFDWNSMERIPYMAPGLAGEEKAKKGKVPTDCWWHSILGTNSRERMAYPTQKPVALYQRLIKVHTKPGDIILDPWAGSGTIGEAAAELGRSYILVDNNPEALRKMKARLKKYNVRTLRVQKRAK